MAITVTIFNTKYEVYVISTDDAMFSIFSSSGQSPGRAIVLPLALAAAVAASALAKC